MKGRLSKNLLNAGILMCVYVLMTGVCSFAQDATGLTGVQSTMKSLNATIYQWVKAVVSLGLFAYVLFELYKAFFSQDKQTHWWNIILVAIFIVVLNTWDTIYKMLTGVNPIS